MGGAFSCGQDNDDLVNILIVLGYIKSKNVERVFREVDRGDYVLPAHSDLAYKDLSWKIGNIHLSAPCVYCKVMEGLMLKPGLSFLNIGSGTGYLSTMAGLILGENGTNHGIEMHEDCLAYAYEHLKAFKEKSLNTDEFEFCEPAFQLGNFLNVIPNRQYDRVYCGAACPEIHEPFVKQFVRVGGILVMPYKSQLLRIERINETTWRNHTMLPVSFEMLASPQDENDRGLLHLPLCQPTTLQELCRGSIRRHLRKLVWSEHSDLERKTVIIPHSVVDLPSSQLPPSPYSIPYLEDLAPEAQRREVVSSALQLVRAVVQPPQLNPRIIEDSDSSEDSDEVRFKVDLSDLFRVRNEADGSTKESDTAESEMHEDYFEEAPPTLDDSDVMDATETANQDNSTTAKAANDSDMKADDSDQAESRFDRSFESRLKRRKSEVPASNNESNGSRDSKLHRFFADTDVPEEAQNSRISDSCSPVAGVSNSDNDEDEDDDDEDDDDDDLNFALIKKAFSILKEKLDTKMEENSESDSPDSSCDHTNGREGDHRDTSVGAKKTSARNSEDVRNAGMTVDDDNAAGTPFARQSNSEIKGGGSNNCIDATPENETNDLLGNKNCSNDDCSSHSRRSVDHTRTSEISDSNIDTLSENESIPRNLYRRHRSACVDKSSSATNASQKRRADQRSESSGSKESSNLQSQSSNSASSNSLSDENDSDVDIRCVRGTIVKRFFAHTIHKEALSLFMKQKVGQLPLPLPLRLYINYNREL